MAALLCQEFDLSPPEICDLTRYQAQHLYLRRLRDEKGALIVPEPNIPALSPRERALRHWRLLGWPDWRIEVWLLAQEVQAATARQQRRANGRVRRRRHAELDD